MGLVRHPALLVSLLLAGSFANACVFPEYDLKDRDSGLNATGGDGEGGEPARDDTQPLIGGMRSLGGQGNDQTEHSGGGDALPAGGMGPDGPGEGGDGGRGGDGDGGHGGHGGRSDGGDCAVTCQSSCQLSTAEAFDCGNGGEVCTDCRFEIGKLVLGTPQGFAGSAVVTWSAWGITFDVRVEDATPLNDSTHPWNDDSIELFLDPNHDGTSFYQGDDFQLIIPRDESAAISPQSHVDANAVTIVRTSDDEGYEIELTLPWSMLGETGLKLGKKIGFDVAIDDDSDGGDRNSQKVAFGTADNYLSTAAYGEITLK